jgi:hypothetical protein
VAGVDEPVQEGLGDDGVGEEGIPVAGRPVAGDDQRASLPLVDQLVEVVGWGRGQLTHGELVEDEHVRPYEFTDPFLPGAVRVTAGEFGEDPAGLGETDVGALTYGEVAQGLGDVGLADPGGAEQHDGLAGVEPAQGANLRRAPEASRGA